MLPAAHRMRLGGDFETAVRRGRRAGRRHVVVHAAPGPDGAVTAARVGFVVSRAVGPAVTRNLVKRRLRAAMAARVAELPLGSLVVVRANPAAAGARGADLGAELDGALRQALRPAGQGGGSR